MHISNQPPTFVAYKTIKDMKTYTVKYLKSGYEKFGVCYGLDKLVEFLTRLRRTETVDNNTIEIITE